jgi:hypothetical protein|tara:strand:+ start:25305 stop:26177 length:873 start_codon:yes stop_codon:yes gene_type:complete
MATNPYFNKFKNKQEQTLVQDIVDESIKIHGVDMVYALRSLQNEDELFGEDRLPKFEDGREIEMYVESYDGFEGEGEVMTQFGLDIKDEMTLTFSKRRFSEVFADKTNIKYPREGDLIYFPLMDGIFEVNFVEREQNFFNFGKTFTYQVKCSLYKYSGDQLDTGFDRIDGVTSNAINQLVYTEFSGGSGEFQEGETVNIITFAGATGATMEVVVWQGSTTDVMESFLVSGSLTGERIVGQSSNANRVISTIGFTADYFAKDAFEDNTEFMRAGLNIFDFTDQDPFSEGDI